MNKRINFKVFTLYTLLIMCVLFITSCSDSKDNKNLALNKSSDSTELKVFLFGEEAKQYRGVSEVLEEFEKTTKDSLNIKLNITWTPAADYKQKLPMWLAAGEEMDLIVDAPWMSINKLAKDGAYLDLESYFNNPDYPGLKKAFTQEYINNNKIFDKLYGIPITNTFMDMEGVAYRKDLLDKYGMKDISSYVDLYSFLSKVAESEKNMVPYGAYGKSGFFKLFTDPNERQLEGKVFSFLGYIDAAISSDGKSVAGIAAYGDKDEAYKAFDLRFGKQYVLNYYNNCRSFGKFLAENVLANEGNVNKEVAAHYITLSGFIKEQNEIKARIPESNLAFWPIYKNNEKLITNSQATDYKAWNFACIPVTSKKADKTMQFMNWIFSSQDNNDLFNIGIKDVHWTSEDNNRWKVKDDLKVGNSYLFPGYELTWNPSYNKIPSGVAEDIQRYFEYQFKPDTFKKTVLAGFTFDQESVKLEIARCDYIAAPYLEPLACGLFENPEGKLMELNKELKDAGVDKIKEELKRQINEFLSKN